MNDNERERFIKIEAEVPHIQSDIKELWSTIDPISREGEELKTELIKHMNKVENLERTTAAISSAVKKIEETIISYDEGFKFLSNARKNINTIFVAIAVQTIFIIVGLLAFVFVLTQKSSNQSQPINNSIPGAIYQQYQQQQNSGQVAPTPNPNNNVRQ